MTDGPERVLNPIPQESLNPSLTGAFFLESVVNLREWLQTAHGIPDSMRHDLLHLTEKLLRFASDPEPETMRITEIQNLSPDIARQLGISPDSLRMLGRLHELVNDTNLSLEERATQLCLILNTHVAELQPPMERSDVDTLAQLVLRYSGQLQLLLNNVPDSNPWMVHAVHDSVMCKHALDPKMMATMNLLTSAMLAEIYKPDLDLVRHGTTTFLLFNLLLTACGGGEHKLIEKTD